MHCSKGFECNVKLHIVSLGFHMLSCYANEENVFKDQQRNMSLYQRIRFWMQGHTI